MDREPEGAVDCGERRAGGHAKDTQNRGDARRCPEIVSAEAPGAEDGLVAAHADNYEDCPDEARAGDEGGAGGGGNEGEVERRRRCRPGEKYPVWGRLRPG